MKQIEQIFNAQKAHNQSTNINTLAQRRSKLLKLKQWLFANRQRIRDTLYADYKKPVVEADLWESHVVLTDIRHALRHLKKWMKPQRVNRTLLLATTRSYIQYQPKGVVLIISPWNFPLMLALGPLVSAIAAGNCVILKPSEVAPATSHLIREMAAELFDETEVAVIEGDKSVAQHLLKLPFDHIFFTGSTEVGQQVMRAAADHMASVTLELGGKSPVIVEPGANIKDAARKIVWGRFSNTGQTCVAPDYVLVQDSVARILCRHMKNEVNNIFGSGPAAHKASPEYGRIIDKRHFDRLKNMLDADLNDSAELIIGGNTDAEELYIEPTIVSGISEKSALMQEEIFGPILPVMTYQNLEEALECIGKRTNPLAVYIFSKNKQHISRILSETTAGASCINDVLIQFIHPNLPFGGVNHSGNGTAHGIYGFQAFSNSRAVIKHSRWSILYLVYPPYSRMKRWLIELIYKYL